MHDILQVEFLRGDESKSIMSCYLTADDLAILRREVFNRGIDVFELGPIRVSLLTDDISARFNNSATSRTKGKPGKGGRKKKKGV